MFLVYRYMPRKEKIEIIKNVHISHRFYGNYGATFKSDEVLTISASLARVGDIFDTIQDNINATLILIEGKTDKIFDAMKISQITFTPIDYNDTLLANDPPTKAEVDDTIADLLAKFRASFNAQLGSINYLCNTPVAELTTSTLPNTEVVSNSMANINIALATVQSNLKYILEQSLNFFNPVFTENVYSDFDVDEVILKYVHIGNNYPMNNNNCIKLVSNMVKESPLIVMNTKDNYIVSCDIPFMPNNILQGTFTFRLLDYNDNLYSINDSSYIDRNIDMYIYLQLLFVKYK